MRKNNGGFTLIEMIIVMVAGTVIALVAMFLYAPVDNWVFTNARRSGYNEITVAMARSLKEMRRLKEPSQISHMNNRRFRFMDIDNNWVDLRRRGSTFRVNNNILARNVTYTRFWYYDEDGNVATQVQDVRWVRLRLRLTSGTMTIRLESAARIRNL